MKVGITGHQDIGSIDTIAWVVKAIEEIVSESKIDLGLTALARGADQIYAQELLKQKIPYIAIIPSKDYQSTFEKPDQVSQYKRLLDEASEILTLDNNKVSENAFFQAGKKLVDMSDFIIAIWDGGKAKGLGGTGDIVNYAVQNRKTVIHINPTNRTIVRLNPK